MSFNYEFRLFLLIFVDIRVILKPTLKGLKLERSIYNG